MENKNFHYSKKPLLTMVNKMRISKEWMAFQKDALDEQAIKAAEILKCEVTDLEWLDSEEHRDEYRAAEENIVALTEGLTKVDIGFQYSWMVKYNGRLGIQFREHGMYGVIFVADIDYAKAYDIGSLEESLIEIVYKLEKLGIDKEAILDIVRSVES